MGVYKNFYLRTVLPKTVSLVFMLWLLHGGAVMAQRKCGTPEAIAQALAKNPALIRKMENFNRLAEKYAPQRIPGNINRSPGNIISIPVVVHIVLPDPSVVSDAQVASQIAEINTDYSAANADTSRVPTVWKSLVGDMQMQFCLAAQTPEGDPSNGIIRVKTTRTQFSINNACSDVKHASTGGSDIWNSAEYLNIWVCNLEGNYLGVTTPPGLYPDDEQGVVIQYNAFGTTGGLQRAYDLGRTTTHEIGHYFYLFHPWGNGDGTCSPGDYVDDTPPQYGPVYDCPAFPHTDQCSPNPPGVMFMNFMEYVDDSCMYMFTKGQVARAQSSLYAYRSSLFSSRGCVPVMLKNEDASIYRVTSPSGKICDNRIAPLVVLKNKGKDTLRSVTISYRVDSGTVMAYSWTGSLSPIDTVTVQLPATVADTGAHVLTVYSSRPNNMADEQPANDTARSYFHLDPLAALPFTEGAEGAVFPPSGWEVTEADTSTGWQKTVSAAHSGNASFVVRNYINTRFASSSDLVTPVFNISNADSAYLYFYVAAAVQTDPNASANNWDTLKVLISTDCGANASPLYTRWGKNLITRTMADSYEFVPAATEWRRDSINLTPYINQGNFQLIFRDISNNENDIYLDDISVATKPVNPYLEKEKVLVVPNPATDQITVLFLHAGTDLQDVEIYNSQGQRVAGQPASAVVNNRLQFNLAGLSNGVYFVKIIYQGRSLTRKIIKLQ